MLQFRLIVIIYFPRQNCASVADLWEWKYKKKKEIEKERSTQYKAKFNKKNVNVMELVWKCYRLKLFHWQWLLASKKYGAEEKKRMSMFGWYFIYIDIVINGKRN